MYGRSASTPLIHVLLPILIASLVTPVLMPFAPRLAAQSHGPLLRIVPDPVDFDTVFCGGSRCIDVNLRNEGDTALTVLEFDALTPPFSGDVSTPLTLQPGESRTVSWCYTPTRVMTRDSIRVRLISDNRIPYSFGFLVDASDAMSAAFPGAASGMDAAHQLLSGFVQTMMAPGSPEHEGAVFSYGTTSQFRLLRGLTTDRTLVAGSIPSVAGAAHACVWNGMDRAISLVQAARHRRVLVVVNASEDAGLANCGPYSAPGVASAALASDMIVCAISLNGAAASPLADIAAQTGGIHRSVASLAEFITAMHDIQLHLQRAVRQYLVVRGEVVSPSLAFVPDAVLFPVTAAGDTARARVALQNVGTAPMDLGAIDGQTTELRFAMIPRQLEPGDSVLADVIYIPTDQSFKKTDIHVAINGCDPSRPALTLRGFSYLPSNPAPGPVLAAESRVIEGGSIPCDVGGEITVPLRNAGTGILRVFDPVRHCPWLLPADAVGYWELGAGESSVIRSAVRNGRLPGADSCAVSVRTFGRVSTSTVFVLDGSSTLRLPWNGIDGMGAARIAIGRLLADLTMIPEIHDRMAVLRATMSGVETLMPMTDDRDALATLEPAPGGSDTTALMAAVETALDTLESTDGIRRLVLLSSGGKDVSELIGRPNLDSLAQRAQSLGVRVTVLHIDLEPRSAPLQTFIDLVGAEEILPPDPEQLIGAVSTLVTAAVDTMQTEWMLRWTNQSSDITASPPQLVFDVSHVGTPGCEVLTVTNTGEIPLHILAATSTAQGFSCGSTLPLIVPPRGSAPLQLCYEPGVLGTWSLDAEIHTNSCVHPRIIVPISGEASDSNAVLLAGEYVARPGGVVTVPVRFDHALPAIYGVQRMILRIAYDPSLLYPDLDRPLVTATGGAYAFEGQLTQSYDPLSGRATTQYDITAPSGTQPLVSIGSQHTLCAMRLRTFLGRALKTDIEILDAEFTGSTIALGHAGSATVRLDSMLWLEQRLIDGSALWGVLGKNAPNPSPGRCTVGYTLHEPRTVRLALYDLHGRLLRVASEGSMPAGAHEAVIDTRGLPAGAYALRLESDAGAIVRLMLVTNQEVTP